MKQLKILIVDDHPFMVDGIRTFLESHKSKYQFIVDVATDGEMAVNKENAYKFDVIIMDMRLPKLDGIQATQAILRNHPKTKILAFSHYDEYANISAIMKAGARGYVVKNIDPPNFIEAIEKILKGEIY